MLDPVDARKSMEHACGHAAGVYAETFWANRRPSPPRDVAISKPTRAELQRHLERFMPVGVDAKTRALHAVAVRDTAKANGVKL